MANHVFNKTLAAKMKETGIIINGEFELAPLARLSDEDQVFVAHFVRTHGSIKEMEQAFGVSYPTIKARLNKIAAQLQFVEITPVSNREEVLGRLEREPVRKDPRSIKYLYVKVVSAQNDNVDVRVPLGLIRAGMRLTTLIPPQAVDHINTHMREHGMKFDLNSIRPDDIEELIKNIADMEVNVKSKNGDTVKVCCGE